MSKKKLASFIFLFVFIFASKATLAYEEVNLTPTEIKMLEVPKSKGEVLEEINRENNARQKREEKSIYFDAEDEVFENKAGKAFSKFINEKAINNKLNRMYVDVESRFLDDNY
ncbi:MAG: hypothetical protein E7Z92_01245 [Cyanobacteria bacterium SIG31]|nr:hypothetical protein [Cyanobacteria bacterium SIG31]